MEYVISIFFLGVMVTLLVGKGLLAAQDFAKQELERQVAEQGVVTTERQTRV